MTMKLYSEEYIQAIATKIREKDGDAATMTVAQMPARIDNLLPKGSREVWLSANQDQTTLSIDTGVAGNLNHTIQVIGYANIYSTTTLVASRASSSSRQGLNLLSSQNGFRMVWGNSGLKQFNYETSALSAWRPMAITLSKTGMTINGFTQGYSAATKTETFSPVPTSGSTANYEIFPNIAAGNTTAQPGSFRRLKIYDNTNTLIHNFVPVLKNDFSLVLLDKVTGNEVAIPSGDAGFAGKWDPQLDKKLNQSILTSDDSL